MDSPVQVLWDTVNNGTVVILIVKSRNDEVYLISALILWFSARRHMVLHIHYLCSDIVCEDLPVKWAEIA